MKKNSTNVSVVFKPVGRFFSRFHVTLFIVLAVGGLAYAVYSLYSQVTTTLDTSDASSTTENSSTVSPTTVSQLQSLYTSNNAPSSVSLPSGRTNPFAE